MLGDDADQLVAADHRQAGQAFLAHQANGLDRRRLRVHGHRAVVHDLGDGQFFLAAGAALRDQLEQAAVRDQPDQPPLVVLHRHVADVPPVHQRRGEIDDVVRPHGEQVLGHELADGAVAVAPVLLDAVVGQHPLADRLAARLLVDHRVDQAAQALVGRALVVHVAERLEHPARARAPARHAVLEDAEVTADVVAVDAALLEPLARHRQQLLQHQFLGRQVGVVEPVHLRADAVAGRGQEVRLHVGEGQVLAHVAHAVDHADHHAEEEGRVGDLVEHRRAGRNHPVLDAQVRHVVVHPVAWAVPAVDRAVVQAQRVQRRDHAALDHADRVVLGLGRQHGAEARDVLLENLGDGVLEPVVAEVHARFQAALLLHVRARVDRVFEDRDAGLVPESLAEQDRRIDRRRQQRRGDHLRDVVVAREVLGTDLEVHLEAGVAGLEHDVVVLHRELVDAVDGELEVLAPHRADGVVERMVTRCRHHRIEAEVGLGQGRQDADQGDVAGEAGRRLAGLAVDLLQFRLHAPEAVALQPPRRQVGLEVEQAEFMRETVVVDDVQDVERARGGLVRLVDQEHLLLRADAPHVRFEQAGVEHAFEGVDLGQQGLLEGLAGGVVAVQPDVLFTHPDSPRSSRPRQHPIIAGLGRPRCILPGAGPLRSGAGLVYTSRQAQ